MSIQLVRKYHAEADKTVRYGGRYKRFKNSVIELLMKVCTVSVETMKIVKDMPE